ncbi:murein L,D-transpeptidase [Lentilactobacillus parafarraginis]|jgi:lipoprotein-anchoring transpeptidase ErfK/SrfK|uniref:ErfK YbiS YcfS YnhG n=3 Tax=Lentilactobacillus parafarraginis TaxID=390842 RepID=A0A0R1YHE5_9LACO|nr:L,D-transpeptidase [Lentilactobacillus parafarraginis]EHL97122.1 ErfK/YbiS/YcfS/YnhG [Lentilactobacillus parafarraginis F0439]KRM41730.1 ErfK YbiS YcfS YnhG [Lentilactobacillus parafarraginis DSM 18390 = JCM 14109]TLQ17021.1 murein L,D-transpeptidase [Lentilactobacillus parafarraginis]
MRKYIQLVVVFLLAVILSGCGNDHADSHHNGDKPKTAKVINWKKSSQNKPYPKITTKNARYILVSLKKQRVYIMSPNNRVLYTMYASTGIHNSTPKGTYHIQQEHGNFFYNGKSREGARYWTSWKDHGIYLFHTVPTNAKGQYIKSEAAHLGKRANSHGCIRLSIPDAKWINRTVPVGTKVKIV